MPPASPWAPQTELSTAPNDFPSFGQGCDPTGGARLDKAIAELRTLAACAKNARLRRQAPAQRVCVGRGALHDLERRGAEREGCCEGGTGLIASLTVGTRYPDPDPWGCESDVVAAVGPGENGPVLIDGGDGDDIRQRAGIR